ARAEHGRPYAVHSRAAEVPCRLPAAVRPAVLRHNPSEEHQLHLELPSHGLCCCAEDTISRPARLGYPHMLLSARWLLAAAASAVVAACLENDRDRPYPSGPIAPSAAAPPG